MLLRLRGYEFRVPSSVRRTRNPKPETDSLAVHIAEQPKDDNKNEDGRDATAAKLPGCRTGKNST